MKFQRGELDPVLRGLAIGLMLGGLLILGFRATIREEVRAASVRPAEAGTTNPIVKIFVGGRLCTGLLGNQRSNGQYSVTAFVAEEAGFKSLVAVGKGLTEGNVVRVGISRVIPQAQLWPGGDPSNGVFFVNWGDEVAEAELRAWLQRKSG